MMRKAIIPLVATAAAQLLVIGKHRRGVRFPTERNAAPDSDDSCAS